MIRWGFVYLGDGAGVIESGRKGLRVAYARSRVIRSRLYAARAISAEFSIRTCVTA